MNPRFLFQQSSAVPLAIHLFNLALLFQDCVFWRSPRRLSLLPPRSSASTNANRRSASPICGTSRRSLISLARSDPNSCRCYRGRNRNTNSDRCRRPTRLRSNGQRRNCAQEVDIVVITTSETRSISIVNMQ